MENPSYQRSKPFVLTDEVRKDIATALADINWEDIRFQKSLTLGERVQIAATMIEVTEQNAVYRLRKSEPDISEIQALRIVRGGRMNYLWQRRKP
jgi:hypothetical protein